MALERVCRAKHSAVSVAFYVGGIFLLTLVRNVGIRARGAGARGAGMAADFVRVTFLLGVSQLAVALLNWLATLLR